MYVVRCCHTGGGESVAQQRAYGPDARSHLLAGVDILARAVAGTLGPCGRSVILASHYGVPRVVSDGAVIASELTLCDSRQNLGVELLRSVTQQDHSDVTDGNSTTILLAASMLRDAVRAVESGENPVMLAAQLRDAGEHAARSVHAASVPVVTRSDRVSVAMSAVHDTALAESTERAVHSAGAHGSVSVERSHTEQTHVQLSNGVVISAPAMLRTSALLRDAVVLVSAEPLTRVDDVAATLKYARSQQRSAVFIAENIEGEALVALRANAERSDVAVAALRPPEFGAQRHRALSALAEYTGASVISEHLGLTASEIGPEMLGGCRTVECGARATTLTGGREAHMARTSTHSVAILALGAATDTEYRAREYRARSGIAAVQAGVRSGVIPGGGVGCLHVVERSLASHTQSYGARIVRRAVRVPLQCIAKNAGYSPSDALRAAHEGAYGCGLNVISGVCENLYEAGVRDAASTLAHALYSAASLAATVVTTELLSALRLRPEMHTHDGHTHSHAGGAHGHTHRVGPGF